VDRRMIASDVIHHGEEKVLTVFSRRAQGP
jgi:hypothetical protein